MLRLMMTSGGQVACILIFLFSIPLLHAFDAEVSIEWSSSLRYLRTQPTLQVVVNPLLLREVPQSKAVFESLALLGASTVRFVPWLPYPRLAVAALEPPSGHLLCGFRSSNDGKVPLQLICPAGVISQVDFAAYGKSSGYCGSLELGSCYDKNAAKVVASACVGLPNCTIFSSDDFFKSKPCHHASDISLAVQLQCSLPNNFTSWDFSLIDPIVEDFIGAVNQKNGTVMPNFSTMPQWLWLNASGGQSRIPYPDQPDRCVWNYEQGQQLVDSSGRQAADYYGRLFAWYTQGGFDDEFGSRHVSDHYYDFQWWEVLNEIEGEHAMNASTYTRLYDAIITGIRSHASQGSQGTRFAGMALQNHFEFDFYSYFLNSSNHQSDVPVDMVTFHFYASTSERGNITSYEDFFPLADVFLVEATEIVSIRDNLNPQVLLNVDETGVILPDDNNPKWTESAPGFPLLYWNAAAANYVYVWGLMATIGVDFVGESQLTGYPSMPSLGFEPQYPSVSLLNWTDGRGNARFWALKMLLEEFPAGDIMVSSTVSTFEAGTEAICSESNYPNPTVLRCLDAGAVINEIVFASYGTPEGSCGNYHVNASCHASNSSLIAKDFCFGKQSCAVPAITPVFGDPCVGVNKKLVIQARCNLGNGTSSSSPLFAQGFISARSGTRKILLVNKTVRELSVGFPKESVAGSSIRYVDFTTAFGPAHHEVLSTGLVNLRAFSVAVISLAEATL